MMVYPKGGLSANPLTSSNATISWDNLIRALELAITNTGGGSGNANFTTYPITNVNNTWDRIPFANTNNSATNFTIKYSDFLTEISQGLSNSVALPYANVLDFGAVSDGVTDNTTAFKAAIATRKVVLVPAYDLSGNHSGYMVGNLVLTNGGGLISYNSAKLIFGASYNGIMIQMQLPVTNTIPGGGGYYPTNNRSQNITIYGLELDGGNGTNISGTLGTRSGVWFDPYGQGNLAYSLNIHSFTGFGFLSQSYKPQSVATSPQFQETDQSSGHWWAITSSTNNVGIWVKTGAAPAPYNDTDTYISEYQNSYDLRCQFNDQGFILSAGNCSFTASTFSRNRVNTFIDGSGNNSGHGSIVGSMINHASDGTAGITIANIPNGFIFDACNIFFTSIAVTNSYGITFRNGILGNDGGINMLNGTNVWIEGNTCLQQFPIIINYGGSTNYGTYNNRLVDKFDNSRPFVLATKDTAGQNLQTWPPTYGSLGAITTNSVWMYPSNSVPPVWWFGHFDVHSNVVYDGVANFGGTGSGVLLPPNAQGVLTNNGSGTTNWSTTIPGAWIATGTLPSTSTDNSWMPITNAVAFTNGPPVAGQALVIVGTNVYGAVLVKPTNVWSSGGSGGPALMQSTNQLWFDTNSINGYSWNKDTNQTVTLNTNGGFAVTIGTNGLSVNTGNSNYFGGINYAISNAAPITVATATAFAGTPDSFTNIYGVRAILVIPYYIQYSTTGEPIGTISNRMTGKKFVISSNISASANATNTFTCPPCSPGDVWDVRNESTGSGASFGYPSGTASKDWYLN
jgi:hypothetical protein